MSETPAEIFIQKVTPLLHLWRGVRVSGMAVYKKDQWFNAGARLKLIEDPTTSTDIESPDQRFLYYVIDHPLDSMGPLLEQLTKGNVLTIEKKRGQGGTFAEISFRPIRPEAGSPNWYPPTKREPNVEQRKSGTRRTSIALVSSGLSLNEILDYDLRAQIDSKLRYADPAYDGLAGLAKYLFPGSSFENWQQTLVEIVAELPFEIESPGSGKITVRASSHAKDGSLTASWFYEPQPKTRPTRSIFRRDEADLQDSTKLQWDRIVQWPEGAERAKITLFYQDEEIQSVQISRAGQVKIDSTESLRSSQPTRSPRPRRRVNESTPSNSTTNELGPIKKRESELTNTERGPSTHVSRDRWTTQDSLGHFSYAYAIYRFLTDDGTRPPLAISIQAPWGGGKTSLMRMIQAQLDPEAAERAEQISRGGQQGDGTATVANVKCEIDKLGKPSGQTDIKAAATPKRFAMSTEVEDAKRRITVWFNTWKYESTEQVWAGLADCIVQQVGDRLGPVERELFWFRLHLRRFDAAKVRQKIHQQITTRMLGDVLPWLWAYLSGPLVSLLLFAIGTFTEWAKVRQAGVLGLILSGLGDVIAAALQAKTARSRAEGEPAAATFGDLMTTPAYSANLGFVHEVSEDLKRVFDIIPDKYLPMVIFIDDLDRCSPKKVAAVVEAINLFLAGEFADCMFILGIDDEMVAAALDEAHSNVIARLPEYARSASMGWRFMDKFVQLPFIIPPSSSSELNGYLDSLFPQSPTSQGIDIQVRDRAARAAEAPGTSSKPAEQIVKEVSTQHPLAPGQEAILTADVGIVKEMQKNIQNFSDDDSGTKQTIAAEAQKYFTNPRDVKRFVNLSRFHYFLRAAREARGDSVPSLEQMLRWLVLSLKWPEVVRWLRRDKTDGIYKALTVLEELGHKCNNIDEWRTGIRDELATVAEKTSWVTDPEFLAFFQAESKLNPLDRLSMCGGTGLW